MATTATDAKIPSLEELQIDDGPATEISDRDAHDMSRMGKKQVMRVSSIGKLIQTIRTHILSKRDFRFISIVGFICILQCSWEGALLCVHLHWPSVSSV